MKRIGIVGPESSVTRILKVANHNSYNVEFIGFAYREDEREIETILQQNRSEVQGWLFSGPVTYALAEKYLEAHDTVAYVQSMGVGVYLCCLKIAYEHNIIMKRISIDYVENSVDDLNIEHLLQDVGIPTEEMFVKLYDRNYIPEDIVHFHLDLWQGGKVDAVITALSSVLNALQKKGVPVYHFTLAEQEIFQALLIITEKVNSAYFKSSQMCTIIIKIHNYEQIVDKMNSSYDVKLLELKLKEVLLGFCKVLDGCVIEEGMGVYKIISSRGVVQKEINRLRDTLENLEVKLRFEEAITAGIGFGNTLHIAEVNAYRALRNTTESKSSSIIIVRDDGKIIEDAGQEDETTYYFSSHNVELLGQLKKAKIGIKTYLKIKNAFQRLGGGALSITLLAAQLSVTERHVSRIINALDSVGLIEYVGEENVVGRGRPGKLYRLVIQNKDI
ncbi:hypothetical protein [Pelosinus sp. sgz500959]|uniref:hypothetical protein n=1 Tax=Pelosinus sp. sgz500959 TaxID=3242472 RepID=UPI00366AB949